MKLTRKTVIGLKTETTQGTDATLSTSTDYILAQDVELDFNITMLQRAYYRSSLSRLTSVAGRRSIGVKFKTELKGSGSAGTAYAPLGAAFQACGMTETVSAGVSVTYAPTSAPASANYYGPGKSCTIEVYIDGLKHLITGCLGTWSLPAEAGNYGLVEFSFMGLYAAPTDSSNPSATYLSTLPQPFVSAALTLQTLAAVVSKLTVDFGVDVQERVDANSATSLLGFIIGGRDPKGTIDPEMTTVASHDFFGKLLASTEGVLTFKFGATAGNIVTFNMPKTQYMPPKYGDRNTIRTLDLPLAFNQSSGDDELTITMT